MDTKSKSCLTVPLETLNSMTPEVIAAIREETNSNIVPSLITGAQDWVSANPTALWDFSWDFSWDFTANVLTSAQRGGC